MDHPKLTFKDGFFRLIGTASLDVEPEKWELIGKECVTTDYKAAARFSQYADKRARKILDRAFVKRYSAPRRRCPPFLDPHQKEGVEWVLTRSRSYLAHAPGAGKTCQAILAALYADWEGQAVFIVPPSLTANWAREVEKFVAMTDYAPPTLSIIPDTLRKDDVDWLADWLIVPDSMLTRPWVLSRLTKMRLKFVAVDEASRFKEPTSQRTIALFGGRLKDGTVSSGVIHQAKHAVLLDGSPMPNRPMELWAPTYAMSPESIDFMAQADFGMRYCGAKINRYGRWEFHHSSNEEELRSRLQETFMHVVPESALSHPERRRSILFMSDDVRTGEQRAWERKNLHLLKLSDISEDISQGELAHFRRELGVKKVPWIARYVSERLDTKNEFILLFAWHREVVFALERALFDYKPGVVVGGTDEYTRESIFESFQDGERRLIIGNIAAMGRGHNLQRADRVIFGEFSWTDELNKQCEKRASRRGNEKAFTRCEYIVAPFSLDEPVLQSVFRKAERVEKIIG